MKSIKSPAVVINVPGSLVQPGLTRKDAFLTQWERSGLSERFELFFLEKVCTPAEVVHDAHLLSLAKKHDTFIQPGLRKALLQVEGTATLTNEQKKVATAMAELMIDHLWAQLVAILTDLNFSCQDKEAIARVPNSPVGNPDVLAGLLDAVRTKITRTACTESHLRAYCKLQESGDGVGLLLEDDLVILPQAASQIETILEQYFTRYVLPWDTVQMGWSKLPDRPSNLLTSEVVPLAHSTNGAYGNTAVLVNLARHSAQAIVDLIEKRRINDTCIVANDVIIAEETTQQNLTSQTFTHYLAWPRYIGPPIGDHLSVIVGKSMDYTQYCWDPEQVAQIQAQQ